VRIGLDALLLEGRPGVRQTGLSRYETRLVEELASLDEDELVIYAQPEARQLGIAPEAAWRTPPRSVANPGLRIAWEQTGMAAQATRDRLDLLHGLAFVVPPLWRGPSVVTIHDLGFLKLSGHAPARRTAYLGAMTRISVRRAARVIAISEHTKQDIVDLFDIDPDKIDVTPLGVSEGLSPLAPRERADFRERHGLIRPTLLYLGTLEPRKNIPNVLRAFDLVAGETDADLILGGAEGWLTEELHQVLNRMRWRERVRMTGFIPEAELRSWLSAADIFVFPSRYEGFGLPPLEAMACGTPVVASTSSSLPAVLGEDALLADPDDIEAIAGAIKQLLDDPVLAADLRRRGLRRAARFTWAETARLTRQSYRAALG
jgi:glycosyltransferase involved in cell wall biosynthesis